LEDSSLIAATSDSTDLLILPFGEIYERTSQK
jgi:hypothetical protein